MQINDSEFQTYVKNLQRAKNFSEIHDCVLLVSCQMGFSYFAITEHFNTQPKRPVPMSIVHYPKDWESLFRRKRLFGVDPVQRASNNRLRGFFWSEVPRMIPMSRQDHMILELARKNGLGDGYTVPANIPGRYNGSCSFGMKVSEEVRLEFKHLPLLDYIGTAAFEIAQSLHHGSAPGELDRPRLTDRQLDCVALLAQGLSTVEIGHALNIRYETAVQHIKDASQRYGVNRRTPLAVRALLDGSLSFSDVIPRISPHS
ncbi:helix-turn-helix transcriptional regulator [Beijerinckia indica]|uniref:Transcriptional regulator, LuxR family n=1 Tax=Beijerinckia indica subsp. indica (strain ATCC 9039 / DSM 1715 / NCIMB 8712) TaxID=395963 RepID=B2IKZ9_BEII9|nr:autoinducer binding domain-containing protein [Beijerinckia indica]ACB96539.1 transcriptional regulator, LuxR family [Beijerinckia indica subsp. indica ATCC 9039]